MAVTGSGTQADPFIVHSYTEFISLSAHSPISGTEAVYIKWFDTPGQTLNCNDYGSEFTWGEFTTQSPSSSGNNTFYIDLNGATIKNFLIASGKTMFNPKGHSGSFTCKIEVYNGSFRNVFMGSATSKVCSDFVKFHDISLSVNTSGSTVIPFDGADNLIIDNSAMYLVANTLNASLIKRARITDTDIELHIANQNQKNIFGGETDTAGTWTSLTDCRIQGNIGGAAISWESQYGLVFGASSGSNSGHNGKVTKLTNCVIDVDLTDSYYDFQGARYQIYHPSNTGDLNTNVFCNSHYPSVGTSKAYVYPSNWNYMSHEQIRNGEYLNSKGFIVVEVVGG